MKKLLLSSLLASILLMVWGFVWWALVAPAAGVFPRVAGEAAVLDALSEHLPGSGAYFMPYADPGDAQAMARHESGPLVTVFYHAEGAPPMAPSVFVGGWLHMLLSTLLMAVLLYWLSPRLASYGERFGLVMLAGLAGAVYDHLGEPVWFYQPWSYHLFETAYSLTSWAVVGAVLAWFLHGDRR